MSGPCIREPDGVDGFHRDPVVAKRAEVPEVETTQGKREHRLLIYVLRQGASAGRLVNRCVVMTFSLDGMTYSFAKCLAD